MFSTSTQRITFFAFFFFFPGFEMVNSRRHPDRFGLIVRLVVYFYVRVRGVYLRVFPLPVQASVFFYYFCVPETRGKTLEQISDDLAAEFRLPKDHHAWNT